MIEERKRNGDTAEEESKEGERESTWIQKRESVTSGGSGGSSQPERERETPKKERRNQSWNFWCQVQICAGGVVSVMPLHHYNRVFI